MSNLQKARPAIITISDNAADRIKQLLAQRGKESLGIRVGVKAGGCSGLSYVIEYADEKKAFEEEISAKGVNVFIDPKAVMYVIGSEMDYVEDKFKAGFIFKNPNEKGRCGCGESFHV
ncbi:MAG: iscA [Rickettsiaceae bacterium]|jgi:iron-sulfur cluster assembly protein|nr:iscA [Rickettsiaceae bacterium]